MTESDIIWFIPMIKKLASNPVYYVKVEMSQNIVVLIEVCSQSIIHDEILPIIFNFIKTSELALGIIKSFKSMAKRLPSNYIE